MGRCRTVLAVVRINVSRAVRDIRIVFIFLCTAVLIIYYLAPVVSYGLDYGKRTSVFILPMMFGSSAISIKTPKILFHLGVMCLFSDSPFIFSAKRYIIMRSRRRAYALGECVYIAVLSFIYILFISIIAGLVVLRVSSGNDSYSGILTDMELGGGDTSIYEIAVQYPHIVLPRQVIQYLYPSGAELYTFLTAWCSFTLLGLIIHYISLWGKIRGFALPLAGILVFIDPLLVWASWPNRYWMLLLSPVSWTSVEQLHLLQDNHWLTISYVIAAFFTLIILFITGICRRIKKMELLEY